jgi:site-specific DNA-methyltransferase (adenine-specific)
MSISRILFSSASDNWATPDDVYNKLNEEFNFNFDPCPLNNNPDFDGLTVDWGSSTFVNPPYSDIKKWCEKSYNEWKKGKTVVMLIPSRTDTRYWHDYIMKATEIRFIKGRLKFGSSKNSAPFPSAIIVFNINKQIERGCDEDKIENDIANGKLTAEQTFTKMKYLIQQLQQPTGRVGG